MALFGTTAEFGSPSRGFLVPLPDVVKTRSELAHSILEEIRTESERTKQAVLEDLQSCGFQPELSVSIDELVVKLCQIKKKYDEEVVRRVYSMASTLVATDTTVTSAKFAEAYGERQWEVRGEVLAKTASVESVDSVLRDAEMNLRRAEACERTAIPGDYLSGESKLTVQVIQAVEVTPDVFHDAPLRLHLECQNQEVDTHSRQLRQGGIFWNEIFTFEIISHEGELRIELRSDAANYTKFAECSINLDELADQRKRDFVKELWGDVKAKLHISAQWVYSKKQLFLSYVREAAARKDERARELADYQDEYNRLMRPFGFGGGGMSLLNPTQMPEALSRAIDQVMENLKLTNYERALQFFVVVSLVLCCIASYSRPLFLDLCISGFAFWCNLDPRRWTVSRYTVILAATLLSLTLDVVWMVFYFNAWGADSAGSDDMRSVTRIFSLFNFLWKFVTFFFIWKCRYDLQKKSQLRGERLLHEGPRGPFGV